ncbi:MAG: fused MFS/spermidine synthase, partial [Kiritimatiellia bacterium]
MFPLLQWALAFLAIAMALYLPAHLPFLLGYMREMFGTGTSNTAPRFASAFLFLALPSMVMGGALPSAMRCLEKKKTFSASGAPAGWLYGVNCLGAAAGAVMATEVLIPWSGLRLASLIAGALNLAAGTAALAVWKLLHCRGSLEVETAGSACSEPLEGNERAAPGSRTSSILLALLFGTAALSAESLHIRAITFYSASTLRSFSAVSTIWILALGLGSFLGGWWLTRRGTMAVRYGIPITLGITAIWIGVSLRFVPSLSNGGGVFWRAAIVGGPAALALGSGFPLLVDWYISGARRRQSVSTGFVLGAMNIGAIAGPAATALFFLPKFGTAATANGLAVTLAAAAAAFAAWCWRIRSAIALLAVCAALVMSGADYSVYRVHNPLRMVELRASELFQIEDVEAVVTVASEYEPAENRHLTRLYVGRKMQSEDSTPWLRVEKRMGALPALLCPLPDGPALHVGMGSGVTAAWAAAAGARPLTCLELVGSLSSVAHLFRPHNSTAMFSVRTGDGRAYLLHGEQSYASIVTDIVFPEDLGAANLFSLEYFALARSRLAPGGSFVHWIPLFQMPPDSFCAVIRSFMVVFPDATLWEACVDAARPVVMLLGVKDGLRPWLSYDQLKASVSRASVSREQLAELGLDTAEATMAHFVAGPGRLQRLAGEGVVFKDDRPVLEWAAQHCNGASHTWALMNLELILRFWQEDVGEIIGGTWETRSLESIRAKRTCRYLLATAAWEAIAGAGVKRAVQILRRAHVLAPEDAEVAFALWDMLSVAGMHELAAGRAATAKSLYEEALRYGPMRDFVARELALASAGMNDTTQALHFAREAVRLDPKEP